MSLHHTILQGRKFAWADGDVSRIRSENRAVVLSLIGPVGGFVFVGEMSPDAARALAGRLNKAADELKD